MIVGMNDDIHGGICMGGIAHAGMQRLNRSMWFDGVNDYLRYVVPDAYNYSTGTICAWLYASLPLVEGTVFCSADTGGTARYLYVGIDNLGRVVVSQRAADTVDRIVGSTLLATLIKTHIAVISDGAAYTVYVNGIAETLTVTSGGNNGDWFAETPSRDNIAFGALARSTRINYLTGIIQDARIYDRALNSMEIAQVMAGNAAITGLIGRWQGGGNTPVDWEDLAGSYDLILSGSPDVAYIRGDGKILKNGVVINP